MDACPVCGFKDAKEELIDEIFQIDGKPVLVRNIPATRCNHCGEVTISRNVTEKVRRMVHGEATPVDSMQVEVYAFNG